MSDERPNIIFIMSDDHAAHAMSCYGSKINETPHLDRIANEGIRFDHCLCTNAICAPSRAVILTGLHSHMDGNGVTTLQHEPWDNSRENVAKIFQRNGYQTAIVGKWHLGEGEMHHPTGFDEWCVLPGQGLYHNPKMIHNGEEKVIDGYVTDIITDLSLDWLKERKKDQSFFLCVHHKAPHREWEPDDKHAEMYEEEDIREPDTFNDTYEGRSEAVARAKMRITDLNVKDTKVAPPEGLSPEDEKKWKYQRYIKDYLRCVASIDDNTGRLLDYLDAEGLTENTLIMYTSDQGFFLGDHGWFDKRFMYEESLMMPFVARWPKKIKPGSENDDIITNLDFAPTWLELAGIDVPENMQGEDFGPLLEGTTPEGWQDSMYYRYWMHNDSSHETTAHYGIRTKRYKLIYYYGDPLDALGARGPETKPEWEMFDLEADPAEMKNVYDDPEYASVRDELKGELARLQEKYQDEPYVEA